MNYVIIGIYIISSVLGVVFFKIGSTDELLVSFSASFFSLKIHWLSVLGLILYIFSFLLYMGLIARSNLSQLVPVSTGIMYICTLLSAVIVFKETMHGWQIIGSILILAGVILMNIKAT